MILFFNLELREILMTSVVKKESKYRCSNYFALVQLKYMCYIRSLVRIRLRTNRKLRKTSDGMVICDVPGDVAIK